MTKNLFKSLKCKPIIFSLMSSILAASVGCNGTGDVASLAKENIKQTTPYPETIKFIEVSKADSAFGINFFTEDEVMGILATMQEVTDIILSKSENFMDLDSDDPYLMSLAERHMESATAVRSIMMNSIEKGEWSGWKIAVKYSAKDKDGLTYTNTRWLFANREGNAIQKYFDIPNP